MNGDHVVDTRQAIRGRVTADALVVDTVMVAILIE
jgi:hypothetical protein